MIFTLVVCVSASWPNRFPRTATATPVPIPAHPAPLPQLYLHSPTATPAPANRPPTTPAVVPTTRHRAVDPSQLQCRHRSPRNLTLAFRIGQFIGCLVHIDRKGFRADNQQLSLHAGAISQADIDISS